MRFADKFQMIDQKIYNNIQKSLLGDEWVDEDPNSEDDDKIEENNDMNDLINMTQAEIEEAERKRAALQEVRRWETTTGKEH